MADEIRRQHPDLKKLHEERQGARSFKIRDAAYKLFQSKYNSESDVSGVGLELELSYRPNNVDDVTLGSISGDDEFKKIAVNQVRRIVDYYSSMFAAPPTISAIPLNADPSSLKTADGLTNWVNDVLHRSNIDTLHPRQAHWLSDRGDAIWGVNWQSGDKPDLKVQCWDPGWCYPMLSPTDLGGVEDMLIAFEVHPEWVRTNLNTEPPEGDDKMAKVFYYWTRAWYHVQVDDKHVEDSCFEHGLGFVPFRVVFGNPSGLWAQADVREIPKLQDLFNENLLLSMDAIRKMVDPAWWATGLKKNVSPEPGIATALPEGAKVGEWPMSASPEIIMGVMGRLESYIQSMAGVSPISMTGQAPGSIVTGTAVRHQVEATEQRAETRKLMLQQCYARLAEMICTITAKKFPEQELVLRAKQGDTKEFRLKGADLEGWNRFHAEYGGFLGLSMQDRVNLAMAGLGRLWDEEFAASSVIGLPNMPRGSVRRMLDDYQTQQAITTAKAQALAQQAAQQATAGGQGGGAESPPGGGPPSPGGAGLPPSALLQRSAAPPQPTPTQMGASLISLGQIEAGLKLIESQLKGPVWAVGEVAIAGRSMTPLVMVQDEQDLALVNTVIKGLHGNAVVGSPNGDPKVKVI